MEDILASYRLPQEKRLCSCGRTHVCDTIFSIVKPGACALLPTLFRALQVERAVVVVDRNTAPIAQASVLPQISASLMDGVPPITLARDGDLVPDERAVFEVISQIPREADMIVAVGSGTINDLAKYAAYLLQKPYLCVATAPSMDGYLSTVSPLNVYGTKLTYSAVSPRAIVADLDILQDAPPPMAAAGAGDILGKYTAIADWRLARAVQGDYYCPHVADKMLHAVDHTAQAIRSSERGAAFAEKVMEALILSGAAMSYVGNSRPASGAEHHLAHYFELLYLKEGRTPVYHGTKVALCLLMVLEAYRLFQDDPVVAQAAQHLPSPDEARDLLARAGLPVSPAEIGLTKEEVRTGLGSALRLRDRFTIMHYADAQGRLAATADEITARICR